jgi:hypothetical protein
MLNKANKKNYLSKYKKEHRKETNNSMRILNLKYKKLIFQELGAFCNHCGENDPLVLQIDHINGQGYRERRKFTGGIYYHKHIYDEILKGSKNYQILCSNCNQRKEILNKEMKRSIW